jgi:hypothetical protein
MGPAMGKMAALLASHTWAVGWWLSFLLNISLKVTVLLTAEDTQSYTKQ